MSLLDITSLFPEQLTRTFEVLVLIPKQQTEPEEDCHWRHCSLCLAGPWLCTPLSPWLTSHLFSLQRNQWAPGLGWRSAGWLAERPNSLQITGKTITSWGNIFFSSLSGLYLRLQSLKVRIFCNCDTYFRLSWSHYDCRQVNITYAQNLRTVLRLN